jgi:predicted small secreted protein
MPKIYAKARNFDMKKILLLTVLFALIGLLLTACEPILQAAGKAPTAAPTSSPPPSVTQTAIRDAAVESVEIQFGQADPGPVVAIVRGHLSDACSTLQEPQVSYKDGTFYIKLTVASPVDRGCIQLITPFDRTIALDTTSLVPGTYTVAANDVSNTFNFPADAPQTPTSLQLVIRAPDGTLKIANLDLPLNPTARPTFNGFLPSGGGASGNAYVLVPDQVKAVVTDGKTFHDLEFIQSPASYGLVVWPGDAETPPLLAWATKNIGGDQSSTIKISAPNGTLFDTLLTQEASNPPSQLVPEFWSTDGQWLYFSKEPVGIGGFIFFGGGTNLYKINITTKEVFNIFANESDEEPVGCLDSISPDFQYVAEHCSQNFIRLRYLATDGTAVFKLPAEINGGILLAGSARFSPDGSQLTYAVTKGLQDDVQGWVVVSKTSIDTSRSIMASPAGSYYNVVGWLDEQYLLVQATKMVDCSLSCKSELWTVKADGSEPQKVADGTFLAMVPNDAIIQLPAEPPPMQGKVTATSIDIVPEQGSGKACTPESTYFVHASITTDGLASVSYEIGSSAGQISAGYFDQNGAQSPYITSMLEFEQAGTKTIDLRFVGPYPYPDNISVLLRVNAGQWVTARLICP